MTTRCRRKGRSRAALLAALAASSATLLACEPEPHPRATRLDAGAVRLSFFALGDTGQRHRVMASWLEGQIAVADAMLLEARRRPVDALVLLGDNFYSRGLQQDELVARIGDNVVMPYCAFLALDASRSAEVADRCRVAEAARRPVPVYAVLGNHDFLSPESPDLQRYSVPLFAPGWHLSAGHAESVELGAGVSLVLFQSEPSFTPEHAEALRRALVESKGPWRILATHRSIEVDDWGSLPAEGPYTRAVEAVLAQAGRPVHLFLAGHHHSLQLVVGRDTGPPLHVVAGSGSRSHEIQNAHPGRRFESTALGFARVDLMAATGPASPERLSVSLFGTADVPLLAGRQPSLLARFSVDDARRVRDELADSPTRRSRDREAALRAPDRRPQEERPLPDAAGRIR